VSRPDPTLPREGQPEETIRFVDERLGVSPLLKKALRYVFPDHWSFLLGEIALYSFVVLVGTGIFLTLFFTPDTSRTLVYHGGYAPLQGMEMTPAYQSTLDLSLNVKGGLLMRQTHHWAALVFIVAIVVHLMRIFFTGAFRKPRDVNYVIGVAMLGLSIFEGFAGYSLPDDLLSGMGLVIAWSTALAIPLLGGPLAVLLWGGEFPGSGVIEPRLFIVHVFLVPAALATLIGVHLAIIMRQKHSQFPGPGRREHNVVGSPMWPGYALRSTGLMLAVAAALFLAGGLLEINPVWLWGPYHVSQATNGAQPDWYLGWLIGAMRLMPSFEVTLFGRTVIPNPFFGGILFPTVVFATLLAWPSIERRFTRDRARHDLLDRPRDRPVRTAIGAAFFSWVLLVFFAGSTDRVFVLFSIDYESQIHLFRVAFFVVPVIVFLVAKRTCEDLRRSGARPLRGWSSTVVAPDEEGGAERTPEQERRRPPGGPAG
jgi:ubiquinol-cytochrome c reductase cytochrome b subunit